jgi:hypothetical protein
MKPVYIIVILIVIFLLISNIGKSETTNPPEQLKTVSDSQIKSALKTIRDSFGTDIARQVEQVYRFETAHFTSKQFRQTFSAGMVATKKDYPYGWSSYQTLWDNNPVIAPVGLSSVFKSGGKEYQYVAFPDIYAGMVVLASYIKKNGVQKWGGYEGYQNDISKITPSITNSL